MPKAVVCLPTYNERANLEPMLRALGRAREIASRDDIDLTVLVIDDNSPDGTGHLAEELAKALEYVDVLRRPRKEGLGPAYLAGFRRALADGADLVLEMDCDFSHDPDDVPRLIAAAADADLVVGSRYVAGGGIANWGLLRRLVSAGGSWYARVLLGVPVRDMTGGFKCYRRSVLDEIDLDAIASKGYAFQIETTYRTLRAGFRVVEIPIVFADRAAGGSKMSRAIVAEAIWKVPALLFSRHHRSTGTSSDGSARQALAEVAAAVHEARGALSELSDHIAETRRRTEELVALHVRDLETRVALGGFTGAKLLADAVALECSPTQRMRVRRLEVGDPVTRSLRDWIGVTQCVTGAEDTRRLWEQLLAREAQDESVLRGGRSTVLDIPDAIVSVDDARTLRVSMDQGLGIRDQGLGIVAVPRFTYATPARKLRNFGHWLVDCVPQASVLATVAPDATILVPGPLKPYQRWTLLEAGLRDDQLLPWDGSPVSCERVLLFESDGRTGGGRPLSALQQLRSQLRAGSKERRQGVPVDGAPVSTAGTRRIYISRRDARNRRRWVSNQAEIEALFRSRGFDVLSMAECPLDEQARIFREAHIVAGISGAGLTNLIFSAPGTHAIVLLSDSLIRWYAESGSKSLWAQGVRGAPGQLAALGDSPRFYAHLAAAFEQVSHYFVGGDEMPLDRLSDFLDAALAQADPVMR